MPARECIYSTEAKIPWQEAICTNKIQHNYEMENAFRVSPARDDLSAIALRVGMEGMTLFDQRHGVTGESFERGDLDRSEGARPGVDHADGA